MNYKPIKKSSDRQRVIPYGLPIYSNDKESSPSDLKQGIVGYWPLSDLTDQQYNNDLTNNGTVSFGAGKIGNAAIFDGLGTNYLSANIIDATNPLFLSSRPFTLAAWVNLTDATAARSAVAIVSFARLGYINTTNNFRLTVGGSNVDAINPILGNWYHLAVTFIVGVAPTSENGYAYVNGELVGTVFAAAAPGSPIQIGARSAVQLWIGKVDEVIFYNKALDKNQIKRLYQLGLEGKSILP